MQKLRRITLWAAGAVLLAAAACNRSDADETPNTAYEPMTVVLGCPETGAGIESRTELAGDGFAVHWTPGDKIGLWARESGAAAFLADVQNEEFRFDYFSPSRTRAGFTGIIYTPEASFTAPAYDYFALTPRPDAEQLEGTVATYTIPDVQSGDYETAFDIMTAQCLAAAPLKAGDNNPTILLNFEHHIHLLKFTIPANNLGEPVSGIELTFPETKPVAGAIRVDAAGETDDDLSGLTKNVMQIDFREPKDAGDTFYVAVAPVAFDQDETIAIRCQGSTGESSVEYTFPAARSFRAGHATPIALYVPQMTHAYTTVRFLVRDDASDNRFGVNTLGERVQTVTLTGDPGLFSNMARVSPALYITASEEGDRLTLTVPTEEQEPGFNGSYEVTYKLRRSERCPLENRVFEVCYESERAEIKSDDYGSVTVEVPAIEWHTTGDANTCPLEIPYLYEEDFSQIGNVSSNDNPGSLSGYGSKAPTVGFLPGWSGARMGARANTAIRLAAYCGNWVLGSDECPARVDSAPFSHLKPGVSTTLSLQFDYGMERSRSLNQTVWIGRTDDPGATYESGATDGTFFDSFTINEANGDYTFPYTYPTSLGRESSIADCTQNTRLAIRTVPDSSPSATNVTLYLFVDNIKVSLK